MTSAALGLPSGFWTHWTVSVISKINSLTIHEVRKISIIVDITVIMYDGSDLVLTLLLIRSNYRSYCDYV